MFFTTVFTYVNLLTEDLNQLKRNIIASLVKKIEEKHATIEKHDLKSFGFHWFSGCDINDGHPLQVALGKLAVKPCYKGILYTGLLFDQERLIDVDWNISNRTCIIKIGEARGFSTLI